MVSNDEISQRLMARREGNPLNGYLVCNKCGGYYELQPGESWKDFDVECACGGQLVQSATDSLVPSEEEYEYKRYETMILIAYLTFLFTGPVSIILGFYLFTRDNERARFNGKVILLLSIIPIFITGIVGLLIYRVYFSQPDIGQFQDIENVRSMRLFITCFLI